MNFRKKNNERNFRMRSISKKGAMKGLAGLCVGLLLAGQVWAAPVSVF